MLLQGPQLAHSLFSTGNKQQQPATARVTSARRCHSRPAQIAVVDTAQVANSDGTKSSKLDVLAKSQLDSTRAEPDMNSRVQLPRNKVLTTTMIAHATNKDVSQVIRYCHHDIGSLLCCTSP